MSEPRVGRWLSLVGFSISFALAYIGMNTPMASGDPPSPPDADGHADNAPAEPAGPPNVLHGDDLPPAPAATSLDELRETLPTVTALLERARGDTQFYLSIDAATIANVALGDYTVDTLVPWASATKPSTVVALMQLVERGVVALDDAVAKHIDGFEVNGKADVTVRHLLTHCGHLGGYDGPMADKPYADVIGDIVAAPLEAARGASAKPVPGENPAYNPAGIWIVAEIVRLHDARTRDDARTFTRIIGDDLYAPLGMTDCFNGMTADEIERYADRIPTAAKRVKPALDNCNPAGGTIGPAWQLARFYEMVLIGRGRIGPVRVLEEETIAEMTQLQAGKGDWTWGLGFNINENGAASARPRYGRAPSPRAFGHNGASGMIAFADPDHGLVCVAIGVGTDVIDAAYRDLGLADDDTRGPDGSATDNGGEPGGEDPNNGDGALDERLERLFQRWDGDGDGEVTRDEVPARGRAYFDRLDRNGDGKLTRDELQGR